MQSLLAEIASAFLWVVGLLVAVLLVVLGRRLYGFAREARQLQEDARVFRELRAQGYSAEDADDAVFSTREK